MERERRTLFLVTAVHGIVHAQMTLFPGVLVLMAADLRLDPAGMGVLGTASFFAFGLGAVPAGALADALGPRRLIRALLAGATVSALLVAWAPGVATLGAGLFLLGLSNSLYHPAGLGLVSRASGRGRAFAVHGFGGSTGEAIAPLLGAAVAWIFGSWRAAYLVAAAASAAMLVLFVLLEKPRSVPGRRPPESPPPAEDGTRTRILPLAVALAMLTVMGFLYRGTITFLPKHLGELWGSTDPGLASLAGGAVATLTLLLGIAGQYLGGMVLYHRFRLEPLYAALLVPCAGGTLLLAFGGPWLALVGAGMFAFFFFAEQPIGNGLVADYTSPRRRSAGYGLHFALAFGVGALGAAAAGWSTARHGAGSAFLLMSAAGALALLLALLLRLAARRGPAGVPPDSARSGP